MLQTFTKKGCPFSGRLKKRGKCQGLKSPNPQTIIKKKSCKKIRITQTLRWVGGLSPRTALSRKKPTGRGAGQGCNSTNEDIDTASEDAAASPSKAQQDSQKLAVWSPLAKRPLGTQMAVSESTCPRPPLDRRPGTLLAAFLVPGQATKGCLGGGPGNLPQPSRGRHSTTAFLLRGGGGGGGLLSEPMDSEPPRKPISPPRKPISPPGESRAPQPGSSMPMLDQSQTPTVCVGNNDQYRCPVLNRGTK